jgi:AraC-like DNA-binding protein
MKIIQVFPSRGEQWQSQFMQTVDIAHSIYFLQNVIYHLIDKDEKKYYIFDHCIGLINDSNGTIGINELAKKTGYTKRYLAMLFNEFIGVSPKTYASIIRFNQLYANWAKSTSANFYADFIYKYYFDQAHFIKEFKKFTGYSPLKFSELGNEYGKLFYNDFPFLQSYG